MKIGSGGRDNNILEFSIEDKIAAHSQVCAHNKHFCMYIIVSNTTKASKTVTSCLRIAYYHRKIHFPQFRRPGIAPSLVAVSQTCPR
jgi:hypothetical protein